MQLLQANCVYSFNKLTEVNGVKTHYYFASSCFSSPDESAYVVCDCGYERSPKISEPTRTSVLPISMACSKSPDIPMLKSKASGGMFSFSHTSECISFKVYKKRKKSLIFRTKTEQKMLTKSTNFTEQSSNWLIDWSVQIMVFRFPLFFSSLFSME